MDVLIQEYLESRKNSFTGSESKTKTSLPATLSRSDTQIWSVDQIMDNEV